MLQREHLRRVPWPFGARRAGAYDADRALDGSVTQLPGELWPGSPLMEACRTLRANLSPGQTLAAPPPLLVLGASADHSSALLAAGLAMVLAEERPTLLVDADLRQPRLHSMLALDLAPGLANALEQNDGEPRPHLVGNFMWVLPAGESARNPAELLRRPTLGRLTASFAGLFEGVVYHAPGRWEQPDALLLAAHVRSAVLAVRAGRDSADQVRRIKQSLERASVDVLGFALLEEEP